MEDQPSDEESYEFREILDLISTKSVEQITELYVSFKTSDTKHNVDDEILQEIDPLSPANNVESNELLSLPMESFQNRQELLSSVRSKALVQGYATTIRRSKGDIYVVIGCDRGGNYRRAHISMDQRKRTTASRLINCPFEIWGKRKPDGIWKVEIKDISHNHEPSSDMLGHPYCRRLSKEDMLRIKEMTLAGISPRQILSSLRQENPNLQSISRNVYNAKAKIAQQSLSGRTMVQALLEELGQGDFAHDVAYDEDGHLTHLFFAHPSSIALTRSYHNIFVMDCTYKTNKYKMPLLDIIGVTSFNSSFYSCFAFIRKEEEGDYVWALRRIEKMLGSDNFPLVIVSDRELALMNAIQVVFPRTTNLLCVWHIEKNIVANCKQHFKEKENWDTFLSTWTNLMWSPSELDFHEAWHGFQVQYKDTPSVLNYLGNTWLQFKERFVDAWTEKNMHFGNRVTSRAEGSHALLKKYLHASTGDLREVKGKICLAIENQYQEIKAKLSSEKVRISHKFDIPFFQEIVGRVSIFALGELYKQYELATAKTPLPLCKGFFSSTMGLPCAHKMRETIDGKLSLVDVHSQWRIDMRSFTNTHSELDSQEDQMEGLLKVFQNKYKQMPLFQKEATKRQICELVGTSIPFIHEPAIQSHKGRPTGSRKRKETSSTSRDPSAFEIVEKARKCSVCKGSGHNSRTCQKNGIPSNLSDEANTTSFIELLDLGTPLHSITLFK